MNAHRKNTDFPACRRGFWGLIGSLVLAFGCNMLQAGVLPGDQPMVIEWYVNGPLGLEQGFTLTAPPEGPVQHLTLALALGPGWKAEVSGTGLKLMQGKKVLYYGVLQARDAAGRLLHRALAAAEGGVELQVTVAGARYPVIIDPLLSETLIFNPQPAPAGKVKCGDILTKDTKLDGDVGSEMDPCPNDGLIIGKDGIEVDLNGHTIWGAPGSGNGITIFGHDKVKIKNGVIKGFAFGVFFEDRTGDDPPEENKVKGLTIETSRTGIWMDGAQDNEIKDNVILGVGPGGSLRGYLS